MQHDTRLSERDWRPNAWWIAVATVFLFFGLGSNLLELRYSYFHAPVAGDWGFAFNKRGPKASVQSMEAGSAAGAVGVKPGDTLRGDNPFVFRNIPLAGETIRLTRVSPGPAKRFEFVTAPANPQPNAVPNLLDRLLDDALRVSLALGGLFILLRGARRRSGFLLGLALISVSPFPPYWLPIAPLDNYLVGVGVFALYDLQHSVLLPVFAIAFLKESGVCMPRWAWPTFWAGVATMLIVYLPVVLSPVLLPDAAYRLADWLLLPSSILGFALTLALLAVGARQGSAEARHRFALLLVAIGLIFLTNILFIVFDNVARSDPRLLTNASTVCRILGTSLFSYAVLRHKVIDVGFTLNRTLVYGGVSAILLAAFGLAEWGLHQILALEGWEGSALFSAALAVAVVLTFHPVRNFVEHYVSTIFFRPWRNKEQRLRRFVHEAGFFTDSGRLAAAFAGALEQFSGASCCVYRTSDDRSYVCATGKMPSVHFDDASAVALRAQAAVCEIELGQTVVEGVLAFPMIHAHDLEGFAVLGPKGNGDRYRPDEVELVEWATRQIGQDLYRLGVEQLKREREERDREIAVLAGRNADLQLALTNRSAGRVRKLPATAASAV